MRNDVVKHYKYRVCVNNKGFSTVGKLPDRYRFTKNFRMQYILKFEN